MFNKQQLCDIRGRLDDLESTPPLVPQNCATPEDLEQLDRKFHDLTLAVAEGIESVTRKERRIAATLARARKELKKLGYENAGLEAESEELQPIDATGGEEQGLPAVREALATTGEEASSIEGVPLATMQRVRGMG